MPLISYPVYDDNGVSTKVPLGNVVIFGAEHVAASEGVTGKLATKRFAPGGRFIVDLEFAEMWDDPDSRKQEASVQSFISRMSRLIDEDHPQHQNCNYSDSLSPDSQTSASLQTHDPIPDSLPS